MLSFISFMMAIFGPLFVMLAICIAQLVRDVRNARR